MKIFLILLISIFLQADIFDFWHLRGANRAYKEGNFTKAIDDFKKLDLNNDHAKYDLANSYYKAKRYKEAKSLYEQIKEKDLLFDKWHNLGNTLAFLNDIDGAIKAYKEALKIKDDKDTKYNLDLLEKLKKKREQQKKKQKQKNKDQKNKDQKKKDQQNKDQKRKDNKNKDQKNKDQKNKDQKNKDNKSKDQKNKDQKNKDKNDKSNKNKDDKNKKSKDSKKNQSKDKNDQNKNDKDKKQNSNKAKAQKPKDLMKMKQQKMGKSVQKPDPISDKEVKKYLKMLDKRGVNTLLIPLNSKGANDEELKNW